MNYLMAVQAPAYRLTPSTFATESAFAEHLRELRRAGDTGFTGIVLIAPEMSETEYLKRKDHLGVIDAAEDGISFVSAYPDAIPYLTFWRNHVPRIWRQLKSLSREAAVMHADLATDIRRPMTAIAIMAAWSVRCPTIFVVDIDFRKHASRFRQLGHWGMGKYLFNRLVQDNGKRWQIRRAARKADLLLLKGTSLVDDFGRGRPNVKNFFDVVHSDDQILSAEDAASKAAWLRDTTTALHACYFGRMVENKGVDRMVDAVADTLKAGCAARLSLIGDGPALFALRRRVEDAGLGEQVAFLPQLPYGASLFAALKDVDLILAAPLIEDTPRAAFDAMARGIPVLAFDISYFKDLAAASGAVALARWPEADALADQMIALATDRERLVRMSAAGLAFARKNTQQKWLERRMSWTRQYALRGGPFSGSASAGR